MIIIDVIIIVTVVNGRPIVFCQMIITFNIHFMLNDYVLLNELNLKHYYSDDGVDYKNNCYFFLLLVLLFMLLLS